MSSCEPIFLAHSGSELHATLLSLSPLWVPSNPAYALTGLTRLSPIWPQALTLLSRPPLAGLSLHRATSSLSFALAPLIWWPIYMDAPLILFCFQHPSLGPLAVPVPHSICLPCLNPSNELRTKDSRKERERKWNSLFVCVFACFVEVNKPNS